MDYELTRYSPALKQTITQNEYDHLTTTQKTYYRRKVSGTVQPPDRDNQGPYGPSPIDPEPFDQQLQKP